ncbi:hypothetical protein [Vibrio hangzhouensis]|uniref:hypothetical protein n=1 Tax=Vibrio hangzhouensis TaxID=462991 RepID=UPI001C979722|nr:hypothetical protein [Vibrio hangzhouensis]MBY6196265.1 hypothetical protein [Vibrio hangzhouensis]
MKLKTFLAVTIASSMLIGCGANTTQRAAEGAAMGAVSAGMLGALTDLIVDGEVNTYRLSRNVTAGALAGGAAGAIDGYSKDQQQEAQQKQSQSAPAKPALEFGPEVETSLNALISCQHDDAYRAALAAEGASQESYREAGIVMQALIDFDRNNTGGVERAIDKFVKLNTSVNDPQQAKVQLESLHKELQQERQIAGLAPNCS